LCYPTHTLVHPLLAVDFTPLRWVVSRLPWLSVLTNLGGDFRLLKYLSGARTTRVSVILVNYNGMPHVDTCIPSVLRQTYSDFEVIFVDNNSADGSLDYVRTKFPDLMFVANKENLGYAGGINAGLAHATGEYVAPLNVDTEVTPNWLSTMVAFLDENPHAGAVTPKILLFDDRTRINALGLDIHMSGLGFCRRLGKHDDTSIMAENVPGISGCSYLIRRELLEQMGGAPGWCFMWGDDVIVSWLLRLMGYEIYCLPESVIFHKYRQKMSPEKLLCLERNRQILLLSTLKPLTLLACLPIFLAVELLIIIYALAKGRSFIKAKIAALASLWRERRDIKQRRGEYQPLRKISDFALFQRLKWNLEWAQLLDITR
jgi:GT2 family glycosyltransferase